MRLIKPTVLAAFGLLVVSAAAMANDICKNFPTGDGQLCEADLNWSAEGENNGLHARFEARKYGAYFSWGAFNEGQVEAAKELGVLAKLRDKHISVVVDRPVIQVAKLDTEEWPAWMASLDLDNGIPTSFSTTVVVYSHCGVGRLTILRSDEFGVRRDSIDEQLISKVLADLSLPEIKGCT